MSLVSSDQRCPGGSQSIPTHCAVLREQQKASPQDKESEGLFLYIGMLQNS